ncbi:MAG TPA: hypothetical protein DEH02_06370 [Bacteroidales bacterium]|nr:MAG: hypothetical protein A2X01_19330 [Bacteroidetes bacterium GWF2_35_48]OFY99877.1 MAG: hypothetical protein A2491_01250 [Bacteroidetes bacterium RIFOXYC12_FULL_35_7]HBX50681.1 hypothetical protein [Bacteroidales bacterium]
MYNVHFIFPPLAEHSVHGPFLAPFLLSSLLPENKWNVQTNDINIQLVHFLLEKKTLTELSLSCSQENEKSKYLSHISEYTDEEIQQFSTEVKIRILKIIRKLFFQVPETIKECFSEQRNYPLVIELFLKNLIVKNKRNQVDIIAFSVPFAEQIPETLYLSRLIKKEKPHVKIIIGGSQINLLGSEALNLFLQCNLFDCVCKGDFTSEIEPLLEKIVQKSDIKYTMYEAAPVSTQVIENIPACKYKELSGYYAPVTFSVLVSKGCYWGKCVFCDYKKLSFLKEKQYCVRPVDKVIEEIKQLQKQNKNVRIFLTSDAVPIPWIDKLCDACIHNKIKLNAKLFLLHSELLTPNIFRKMAEAGIVSVTFGTENTDEAILFLLKKNFTFDTICNNIKAAAEAGIEVIVNIIPDVPGITKKSAQKTLQQLKEISRFIASLNVQSFSLTSDTEIALSPENFNIKTNHTHIYSSHGYHSLDFEHTLITKKEQSEILKDFAGLANEIKAKKQIHKIMFKGIGERETIALHPFLLNIDEGIISVYSYAHTNHYEINENEYLFLNKIQKQCRITYFEFETLYKKSELKNTTMLGFIIKLVSFGIIKKIE